MSFSTLPCQRLANNTRGKPRAVKETLLLLLTNLPYAKYFFVRSFVFFVFVFWSTKTTTANLQYLAHLTPSKSINQVTLNNEYRNYLYWAQFDLFLLPHKSLPGVYFPFCVLFTKRRARFVDCSLRHLGYLIFGNQEFNVIKLSLKIY